MDDPRKTLWLDRLQKKDHHWKDGDLQTTGKKTADLVNDHLRAAMELKLDTIPAEVNGATDIQTVSNRFKTDARDSNKKFKIIQNIRLY